MSIELHPQGVVRYLHLNSNPIYYYYAFQFTYGDFYRAIFGYEHLWDEAYETQLIVKLDELLSYLHDRKLYYFEDLKCLRKVKIYGLEWKRGIKPITNFLATKPRHISRGERILARINLLDKPHHVDLEFENGDVMTVSFMRFLRWKQKNLRSLNETSTGKTSNASKDAPSGTPPEIKGFGGEFSTERPNPQLPSLPKRRRRFYTVPKA